MAVAAGRSTRSLDCIMTSPHQLTEPRLLLAAWLVVAAWGFLGALMIQIGVAQFASTRESWLLGSDAAGGVLALFLAFGGAYAVEAWSIKCPNCGGRLLVERFGPKHPAAMRIWAMDHWASAVVSILRKGQCTCMHCGALVRAK